MRTQQFIDFSNQITGAAPVPDARASTVVEKLRHVLVASLFDVPGNGSLPGSIGLDFDACLSRFQAEMEFPDVLGEAIRKLLDALGILGGQNESARREAWTRLYVVGLHSIARAVALFEYQCALSEGDGGPDDDPDEAGEDNLYALPGAKLLDAARPLAEWLRRNGQGRVAAEEDEDARATQTPRALAKAIALAAIATTGDHLRVQQQTVCARNGTPLTLDCIVASESIADRLAQVFRNTPHAFTLQPLREPPLYSGPGARPDDADPATTTRRYLVDWRISTPFLRKFAGACHTPEFLAPMIKAVNAQQAVRWRINRRLMEWVRVMAWLDTSPTAPGAPPHWIETFSVPVRKAVKDIDFWPPTGIQIGRLLATGASGKRDPNAPVLLRQQRTQRLSQLTPERKPSSRSVNPLDNPLVSSVFASCGLNQADDDADAGNTFYLAWFADFRGRIYVDTPWFTPQGADVQRAMIEFAEGQRLTPAGRCSLKRHGGGLARRSLILQDLGIVGRSVVTFDERERWVDAHVEQIRASAQNPLANTFWFHASGDPLQFLAFCIEWDRQCENPDAPCHLPVQIDGSCSGLQHMAALTASEPLALAVNVKPRADGLPGDIYSDLADAVRHKLKGDPETAPPRAGKGKKSKSDEAEVTKMQAYDLLRQKTNWISRDTAKKVVMTVPYGAGTDSQAEHVLENLIDSQCPLPEADAFALEALGRQIIANRDAGKPARDEVPPAADHETAVWWGLSRLAFYIALELRQALGEKYPAATRFKEVVSNIGNAVLNNRGPIGSLRRGVAADRRMPLAWPAPSGLAVCQPGFAAKRASVTITLRGMREVSVGFTEHLPQIDAGKQANSLMPNLIHCLDATHLIRTIHAIALRGVQSFGTIHDCIQCLPNDLEAVEAALRDQFAGLYAPVKVGPAVLQGMPQVLFDWYEWMSLLNDVVRAPQPKQLRLALAKSGGVMAQALLYAAPSTPEWLTGLMNVPAELVARIERLSGVHRAVVDCLVDALADEPTYAADGLAAAKTLPSAAEFFVPGEGRLDVNAVHGSPYFFS